MIAYCCLSLKKTRLGWLLNFKIIGILAKYVFSKQIYQIVEVIISNLKSLKYIFY